MLPLALLNLVVTGAIVVAAAERGAVMLSVLNSLWVVFRHMFRRRVTIQYPEQKAYLPPRWRGRIILSRDPDGGERCVACYLCAVVCPVACIALQATEDEHGRRFPEFFRINFSRCIFCGFCEDACPTYAIQLTPDFEMSEYTTSEPRLRKGGSADRRTGQVSRLQLLPGRRRGDWRGRQGEAEHEAPPADVRTVSAVDPPWPDLLHRCRRRHRRHGAGDLARRTSMHGLLYLIVSLLAVALIFLALGAPFVAALEVIIYAGAIMVLFVFVIMLLNLGPQTVDQERTAWLPRGTGSARSC